MFYSIFGLCPRGDLPMGRHGFGIKLFPGFQNMVAAYDLDQEKVNTVLGKLGRGWLDSCGYDMFFDPDNCGCSKDEKLPLGPDARPSYVPNQDLRVSWGEWGPEHITVPGDACGLDLDTGFGSPRDGRLLSPHNVDNWSQVQLLLITFCWFADALTLNWEIKADNPEPTA